MEFYRGIVKVQFGAKSEKLDLFQEPKWMFVTDDEELASVTEHFATSENDADYNLILTINTTPHRTGVTDNISLIDIKIAHLD